MICFDIKIIVLNMSLTKQISYLTKSNKLGIISTIVGSNSSKLLPQIFKRYLAAAPTPSGAQPIGQRRFRLPVEEDAHKLVNYCCGANYFQEGEEIKLKPDEEYPEWIWSLRLNYPPPLHELDMNTKEFWERLAVVGRQQMWKLRKVSRQRFKIVSEHRIRLEEIRWRRRFRALAHKEFDAGYEILEFSEREDYWKLDTVDRFKEPDEPEPFYPGIDSVEIPYEVRANRLPLRTTKKCGHFGW